MSRIHVADKNRLRPADWSQDSLEFHDPPAALAPAGDDRGSEERAVDRLLDTYEQYRKLVAYEIHDGVVQLLTGAVMNLEASMRLLGDLVPSAARRSLDRAAELLHDGITEARALMNGLRPEVLDDYGLTEAIDRLVRESRGRTQATIELSCRGDFDRLAPPLETTLFRIVQESLANALRHSHSSKVRIALTQDGQRIRAVIEDWGRGFNPQKVAQDRFGIRGICQRARVFGGKATVDSAAGNGTRVVVDLPFVQTWK